MRSARRAYAAKKAMTIAADACIYTNHNFTVETIEVLPAQGPFVSLLAPAAALRGRVSRVPPPVAPAGGAAGGGRRSGGGGRRSSSSGLVSGGGRRRSKVVMIERLLSYPPSAFDVARRQSNSTRRRRGTAARVRGGSRAWVVGSCRLTPSDAAAAAAAALAGVRHFITTPQQNETQL